MFEEWDTYERHLPQLEQAGLITRTFRRLDAPRQGQVIRAVLEEAAEKGPTAINIKQVAARAGVSVGSLYQYFNNRQGLLDFSIELCVRYLTDLFTYLKPYFASLSLPEALNAYIGGGVAWSRELVGMIQFFGRAAYQGDARLAERVVQPVANSMLALVREMLSTAEQRGELRPGIDLEAAARMIHMLSIGLGDSQLFPYLNRYFCAAGQDFAPERAVAEGIQFIMRAIGSSPVEVDHA